MSEFGSYIRQARERKALSLRAAARRCGIPHSRLFELETGISSKTGKPVVPTQENIEKLAAGYGVPVDHLFALAFFPGYLKAEEGLSSQELGVVALYRELTPGERLLWLTIGEGLKTLRENQPPPSGR